MCILHDYMSVSLYQWPNLAGRNKNLLFIEKYLDIFDRIMQYANVRYIAFSCLPALYFVVGWIRAIIGRIQSVLIINYNTDNFAFRLYQLAYMNLFLRYLSICLILFTAHCNKSLRISYQLVRGNRVQQRTGRYRRYFEIYIKGEMHPGGQ